jgi:hypothetical protein
MKSTKAVKYQVTYEAWDSQTGAIECESVSAHGAMLKARTYLQDDLGYERTGYTIQEVYKI